MIKKIVLAALMLLVAFLSYAAFQPDTFHIQRTISIQAPPEKIVALINDFHRWSAWSPYEKMDPKMKRTYSGAAVGKGSIYEWEGNEVGQGRMEILETSSTKVLVSLDFVKPFVAHDMAEFTLIPKGDSTEVTWAMSGQNPYLCKVMHLFFDMDKMLGGNFETGLKAMKATAENTKEAVNLYK